MSDQVSPRSVDPSSSDGSKAEPSTGGALAEELVEVQRQRDEYLDQLQRSRAEFLNYQKRARTQAEIDRQYAVAELASDLLGVIDNLERAIEAARKGQNTTIVGGLELVQRQFLSALAKHNIEPVPALNQPFDPNQHDAMTQVPDANRPEGMVVAELTKGYRLRDRILRPAGVAVSVKP